MRVMNGVKLSLGPDRILQISKYVVSVKRLYALLS
jgi:hypothetical protein